MEKNFYIDSPKDKFKQVSPELKEVIKVKLSEKKFSNIILEFISTLEKDADIDLNIFYQNLLNLKIKQGDIYFKNSKILDFIKGGKKLAYYQIILNEITLRDKLLPNSLQHELFHVASSIYVPSDKAIFSGFFQSSSEYLFHIGRMLNEGYTELLCQRYFPTLFNYCYREELKVASLIEEIVGKKNLYDCYFKVDLPKLIELLTQFDTKNNVIEFLCAEPSVYPNKYIKSFVKHNYLKKLYIDYSNNLITTNELVNKIAKCYYELGYKKIDNDVKEIFSSYNINSKLKDRLNYIKIKEKNKLL